MTINGRAIRPATGADAEAVSSVIAVTVRESNARDYEQDVLETVVANSTPERMRDMMREGDFLVAEEDGMIVGIVGLVEDWLRRFFVLPTVQGQGIGRDLLAAMERTALRNCLPVLRVNSSLTARGFYERLGFVSEGAYTRDGNRFVRMSKTLAGDEAV